MTEYLTVADPSSAEYEEKRSKFIANLVPCSTEKEAIEFINNTKSRYWDARHNCFAYIVEDGRLSRFSDDGEPHGTAGNPILDVLKGAELVNVALVVTRYFGGVLLGTGGLVRAYSKASRDAVLSAKIVKMVPCVIYSVTCEYQDHSKLIKLLEASFAEIKSTDFTDKVTVSFALKEQDCNEFLLNLTETFSARLVATETERTIAPFPQKNES